MSSNNHKSTNPKMSSILDRVLDKATKNDSNAAAGPPLRSNKRETRSSVKIATEGSTSDEPANTNNQQTTASTVNTTNTVTDSIGSKISGNSRGKATVTSTPAVATVASAAASRSRKSPSIAAVTSIAERLPKGSRTKPLPPKSSTPPTTTTPSIPTSIYSEHHHYQQQQTLAGDKLSQAISLSSSMPSIPSQMEPIDLDEDGDEHMTENSAFYLTLASDDNNDNKSQHPTSTTILNPQKQQQHINDDNDRGAGTAALRRIDLREKQPSVISVASTKTEYASIIPSVQVDRIANWMGGVKEAMEEDDTIELDPAALAEQQQPIATAPAHSNNNNSNSTTTQPPLKADIVEENSVVTGSRKPALRRPPPAPARHVVTLVNASPPAEQDQAEPIDEVIIPSSLPEEEPLQRNYRLGQRKAAADMGLGSKGKRVFVEDSLSSLPPVPLFHETSNISESDTHRRRSGGEPSTSTVLKETAAAAVVRQGSRADGGADPYHHNNPAAPAQDDLSTIVGGQAPTQDSFVSPLQSLPSFIYETDEEAHARADVAELKHTQNDPSLPSELTASCLQELGLKRKNVRNIGYGPGKRRAKSRGGYSIRDSNIDRVLEERDDDDGEGENNSEGEDEEGEEESGAIALAQRVAFPSSFDLAPMSTMSSSVTPPLSLEVIEGPSATYTPAGRSGTRTNKDNEAVGSSAHQYQHADPNLAPLPSFPSPPASLVFSTVPSMPALPTFPSFLQQEPSFVVLDSQTQTQQTEETEEEGEQSQDVDY
ncbi:hypothetical protein EC991_006266 [Linnemannia zychae]|nr:hypothetical protein EC991_006266 [Linnemannia zychae]